MTINTRKKKTFDATVHLNHFSLQVVSFEKVKLTNNELDKQGQIVLNSMHKFQPRIHLVLLDPEVTTTTMAAEVADLATTAHKSFAFPQTIFTAVTAYQNQLVRNNNAFFDIYNLCICFNVQFTRYIYTIHIILKMFLQICNDLVLQYCKTQHINSYPVFIMKH